MVRVSCDDTKKLVNGLNLCHERLPNSQLHTPPQKNQNLYLLGPFSGSRYTFRDLGYCHSCLVYNWASNKRKMISLGQFLLEICDFGHMSNFSIQINAYLYTEIAILKKCRIICGRLLLSSVWSRINVFSLLPACLLTLHKIYFSFRSHTTIQYCWKNSFQT